MYIYKKVATVYHDLAKGRAVGCVRVRLLTV